MEGFQVDGTTGKYNSGFTLSTPQKSKQLQPTNGKEYTCQCSHPRAKFQMNSTIIFPIAIPP